MPANSVGMPVRASIPHLEGEGGNTHFQTKSNRKGHHSHTGIACVCVLSQRASRSDAMILKRRGKGSYSTMPPEDPVIMTCSFFFF